MLNNEKFKQMLCPVCGEYEFVDDTELEKSLPGYEGYQGDQCSVCGWKYDLKQSENPDLAIGNNEVSLNEYKKIYLSKKSINPNYNYLEDNYIPQPHKCPVCGEYEFEYENSFNICPICGWQDDALMESEPDKWAGNANELCLNDYRKKYLESKK